MKNPLPFPLEAQCDRRFAAGLPRLAGNALRDIFLWGGGDVRIPPQHGGISRKEWKRIFHNET